MCCCAKMLAISRAVLRHFIWHLGLPKKYHNPKNQSSQIKKKIVYIRRINNVL